MRVEPLPIAGALLLALTAHEDARGRFTETYAAERYRLAGIDEIFIQDNVSTSRRGVLRGLHGDRRRQSKLVGVLRGSVYDAVVDVRGDSATYGRWCGVVLDAAQPRQIYVPPGCLHGYLALTDDVLFLYKQSAPYDPDCELAVRYDDPDINVEWPLGAGSPQLSPRDAGAPPARALGLLRP